MNLTIAIPTDSSSWSTPRVVISCISFLVYLVLAVILVKIIRVIYGSAYCCVKLFKKKDKEQVKQLSEIVLKSIKECEPVRHM